MTTRPNYRIEETRTETLRTAKVQDLQGASVSLRTGRVRTIKDSPPDPSRLFFAEAIILGTGYATTRYGRDETDAIEAVISALVDQQDATRRQREANATATRG